MSEDDFIARASTLGASDIKITQAEIGTSLIFEYDGIIRRHGFLRPLGSFSLMLDWMEDTTNPVAPSAER